MRLLDRTAPILPPHRSNLHDVAMDCWRCKRGSNTVPAPTSDLVLDELSLVRWGWRESSLRIISLSSRSPPHLHPLVRLLNLSPCKRSPPAWSSSRPLLLRSSSNLLASLFLLTFGSYSGHGPPSGLSPETPFPRLVPAGHPMSGTSTASRSVVHLQEKTRRSFDAWKMSGPWAHARNARLLLLQCFTDLFVRVTKV